MSDENQGYSSEESQIKEQKALQHGYNIRKDPGEYLSQQMVDILEHITGELKEQVIASALEEFEKELRKNVFGVTFQAQRWFDVTMHGQSITITVKDQRERQNG